MKNLIEIECHPGNSILTVVDMENEFCKPGGRLYTDFSAGIMPDIISNVKGLIGRFRRRGIPIIYIQSVRTLREPEYTIFGRERMLEIGTWSTEIVEELKPEPNDIVVQKFSHDPFYNTSLDKILVGLVPDPTRCYGVVVGGAINVCLYSAVMGFYLRDYHTIVPIDCTYCKSEAVRQRALDQFSEHAYPSIFLSRADLIKT